MPLPAHHAPSPGIAVVDAGGVAREVLPSGSRHVSLALVHVPGPQYTIEPEPYWRISLNIGPSYSADARNSGRDHSLTIRRHGLLVIPPDSPITHRASTPKPSGRAYKPARLASFRISPELFADSAIALGLPVHEARLEHQVVPPDDVLAPLAQALMADLRFSHPAGVQATERLAMALVGRLLLRQRALRQTAPARDSLARVCEHIDAELASPLPLEQLAAMAGMSLFHFCRVFRDSQGMTPHQYILARRMAQAQRLLWAHRGDPARGSVLQVALACGFSSPSHFTAQFKRHTGQTPRAWQTGRGAR